ncbi:MAG: Gmad2 immunoglobulin-like domain-containing protein [Patescibacteria group bacterium]
MDKKIIGLILVVLVLAASLAYIVQQVNLYHIDKQPIDTPVVTQPTPVPTPSPTTTPSVPASPNSALTFTSKDAVTTVTFPAAAMHDGFVMIDNPTMLNGTTTAFEQTFAWKLVDTSGVVVAQGSAMTHAPDSGIPGPFSVTMFYDVAPKTERGMLTVYEASAKDGTPIHDVKIPIVFAKTVSKGCSKKVAVAFVESGGAHLDCSKTKAVTRTVCADASTAQDVALYELLAGPTTAEQASGLETELPVNVTYPGRDVLTAVGPVDYNFDYTLDAGVAGSCRVTAIRAQIADTVGKNAVIGIDGRTEDILQP